MMESIKERLDEIEEKVYSSLKDFQKKTVDRVDELYRHEIKRVLVSDEVGLGKTLIAKGVIAKFAKLRKEENDDLVKVVYVCSNSAIVEQNLNKLKITNEIEIEDTTRSRLSMQHLNIFNQENDPSAKKSYIQFIPLTPDTSFKISKREGIASERALIYAILRKLKEFENIEDKLSEVLRVDVAPNNWKNYIDKYIKEVDDCDKKSKGEYIKYMTMELKNKKILDDLVSFCLQNVYKEGRQKIIGQLRLLFSEISVGRLNPDLVIMDEFQRFRYLFSEDNPEENILAKKFFNNNDINKTPRILLLSATPYKMYSTLEEIDDKNIDEHYSEFLDVMRFLKMNDDKKFFEFKDVWDDYSIQLKDYTKGKSTVIQIKNNAESELYNHICRTERINALGTADIISDVDNKKFLDVKEKDIQSYIDIEKLLLLISNGSHNIPSDYVKSCPYLLSFMTRYKIKEQIEKYFKENPTNIKTINNKTFFIKRDDIDTYKEIPCNNARLQYTMNKIMSQNSELLLWVPPSKSYYTPKEGPYKNVKDFTKTLIFSSWEMVPKMISTLVSYEMERRNMKKLLEINDFYAEGNKIRYFREDKKRYPLPKLNYQTKGKVVNAMTLFCLVYPSKYLASLYNPIEYLNNKKPLKDIEKDIKSKIRGQISKYDANSSGSTDPAKWYYMLPFILDGKDEVKKFAKSFKKLITGDKVFQQEKIDGLSRHIDEIIYICDNFDSFQKELGKKPKDLADILTAMAIASPAVCLYRSYDNRFNKFDIGYPSLIANAFIRRINIPEATAIIEICSKKNEDDAFWKNVLEYCKNGNFQAMIDEYVHLLTNGTEDRDEKVAKVTTSMFLQSLSIRSTPYLVDTFKNFQSRVIPNTDKGNTHEKKMLLRTHFAVAFTNGDESSSDLKSSDRKKVLRNAFNSPFRPFVLASTSIGQEGLDFHNYCRRIVHWNLPSNPIDLEQREGRINRYESLVIRQNIAKRYGNIEFKNDVWNDMFNEAKMEECTSETSELVPYWGLKEGKDMIKIERIIPKYPFSKDELSYTRLMEILNLYRITLGQARQEELIEFILKNEMNEEDIKKMFINLSPYFNDNIKH